MKIKKQNNPTPRQRMNIGQFNNQRQYSKPLNTAQYNVIQQSTDVPSMYIIEKLLANKLFGRYHGKYRT